MLDDKGDGAQPRFEKFSNERASGSPSVSPPKPFLNDFIVNHALEQAEDDLSNSVHQTKILCRAIDIIDRMALIGHLSMPAATRARTSGEPVSAASGML